MATNDDLDYFFKKKERKGNKHKKQTGLLKNNEELLKQLVIVTSATSAFKENMDFDDDEDEHQIHDESAVGTVLTEDTHKNPTHHHKTKIPDDNKHLNGQQTNTSEGGGGQQQPDEWEEFIDPNSKYEQLRLKFSRGNNDDDNEDEYYDDENNPNNNDDNNEKNIDREQQKDKPAWKIDQVKQQTEATVPSVEEKIEEPTPTPPPKPSTTTTSGAYRPPQLRTGGASVTVVSGVSQRPTKKEKPNLASTDEFPTLGSTVNKK